LWLGEEVTKKVFSEHECRKGSSGVDKGWCQEEIKGKKGVV
jgi:hypothetical protein